MTEQTAQQEKLAHTLVGITMILQPVNLRNHQHYIKLILRTAHITNNWSFQHFRNIILNTNAACHSPASMELKAATEVNGDREKVRRNLPAR